MTVQYYTEEGLKKLQEELNQLKNVERDQASAEDHACDQCSNGRVDHQKHNQRF